MNWRLIIARCRAAADLTAAQNWRRTLLTILRAHYRSAAVPRKCPGRPQAHEVSKEQRVRSASSDARAGVPMAGMKISLDSAMRARDVSQPRAADEAAAERTEAAIAASKRGPGISPAPSQVPASTAGQETSPPDQPQAGGPQRLAPRAATGRGRPRRRGSARGPRKPRSR